MKTRTEKDCLGSVKVPEDAYYGSFTTRAKENFKITGQTMPKEFWNALAIVKKAALKTNYQLKLIEKKHLTVINKSIDEFMTGKFDEWLVIDQFQAGAGTPFNMNFNEIIANRANEILRAPKGTYKHIHPNNHINMGQSTNDVIPTSGRIAALLAVENLYPEIEKLSKDFKNVAKQGGNLIKVGRTHLEDAVPMKVSQEYNSFATSIEKNIKRIKDAFQELSELGIGANALGTGINTDPKYQKATVDNIAKLTKLKVKPTKNLFELAQSMDAFVKASSALKIYAIDMVKIANDLKILNMGPKTGLNEILLKEVQPGSSIMPGKINPSIEECVHQIGYQVMGNDHVISLSAQAGQLQLNVMGPVIILNLLKSINLLINATNMWRTKSISGLKLNKKEIKRKFDRSFCLATALTPYIGYEVTAQVVTEAIKKKKSIIEIVQSHKIIPPKDLKEILAPENMTKPRRPDKKVIKKIQKSKNYLAYRQKMC